jgi:hypothetical protein
MIEGFGNFHTTWGCSVHPPPARVIGRLILAFDSSYCVVGSSAAARTSCLRDGNTARHIQK